MAIDERSVTSEPYGLAPVRERQGVPRFMAEPLATTPDPPKWYQRGIFGRVHVKHLINFCRQFASYLEAGVSLSRAMESLKRQYDLTALGPVIGRLQFAIRRGESLTDAMSREPGAFDHFFLSMMRVAEARGSVPETLRMLSHQYDARQRLIRQTKSALVYPCFVIIMAVTVSLLLTILVLPPLVDILRDVVRLKNIELPWMTRMLMRISDFIVVVGWWAVPLTLVVTVVGLIVAYKTERGKAVLDIILLQVPVIGVLARRIDTTRFSRTLATLLEAGVDIGSSLELTADTLLLIPLRRAVLQAREGIADGETLSASIDLANRFPTDLIAIMNSGEETGRLPEMLVMVADEYEEQVEFMVKDLSNLLQPLVILIVGGLVLFIAVAFFMGYASVITTLGTR